MVRLPVSAKSNETASVVLRMVPSILLVLRVHNGSTAAGYGLKATLGVN
jgi:hypothetical protein